MKKAINISIGNTLFYIEEDAYQKLSAYLDSVRSHFASYPDRNEVVADIESRIAEKFSLKGKKIVTIEDIHELIKTMGEADEFADAEPTETAGSLRKGQKISENSKRLYRNPDDAIIAGVSSGIAAYFGIDPTPVRIIFLISLFFGGTGLILYIALWIAMPEAKTATEKLQMQGVAVTLESVSDLVKEKAGEVQARAHARSFRKLLEIPRAVATGISALFSRGIFPFVGKIVGVFLAFAATAVLVGLSIALFSIFLNYPSENIDFPFGEMIHGSSYYYALLISAYMSTAIPAVFFVLLGITFIRRKSVFDPRFLLPVFAVWLLAIVMLGVSGVRISTLHAEFVRTDPLYRIEEREYEPGTFSSIEVRDGQHVRFIEASKDPAVVAEGQRRSLDRLDISTEDGVLIIREREDDRICLFCFYEQATITVSSPNLENIVLRDASRFESDELTLDSLALTLANSSSASLEGNFAAVEAELQNGSRAELRGSSNSLNAILKNSSRLDARNFTVREAVVEAENSSRAELSVSDSLNAFASNGSRIRYEERGGSGTLEILERTENGSRVENVMPETGTSTPLSDISDM